MDGLGGTVTRSVWGHIWRIDKQHDTSVICFGSERAQSKHQCPLHLQWHNLTLKLNHSPEPHKLHIWEGVFTVLRAHQMHYIFPKNWCWAKHWIVNLNFCASRNWINDYVDGKPDSTHEDTHPNFSMAYELWCGVKRTSVSWYEINVMQKIVMSWKWPNVVDIYCKRADAIKRIY